MTPWERRAAESGLRIFPIRIEKAAGRYEKIPLARRWQERANFYSLTEFDWSEANGFGILMGCGFYGLDLDSYKPGNEAEAWFDRHHVVRDTRTHRTISGGLHRIYSVPKDLPTRTGIVPGLDGRGAGGFLAFGEGYEIVGDVDFCARMSPEGRQDIADGYGGGAGGGGPAEIAAMVGTFNDTPPEGAEVALEKALAFGPNLLRHRWAGGTLGLRDKSRSALDHSVAKLLSMTGLDETVVMWAILRRFEHGAARWKPSAHVSLRAAARSTAKGSAQVKAEVAAIDAFAAPEMTPEEEAAMSRALLQK